METREKLFLNVAIFLLMKSLNRKQSITVRIEKIRGMSYGTANVSFFIPEKNLAWNLHPCQKVYTQILMLLYYDYSRFVLVKVTIVLAKITKIAPKTREGVT